MEIHFLEPSKRKEWACKGCHDRTKKSRKCNKGQPDPRAIVTHKEGGLKINRKADFVYPFCPGKATWYPQIIDLFDHCRVAAQTGILPTAGGLDDQDAIFAEVFPDFADLWKRAVYQDIWDDVRDFTESVLKAAFGKGK